MRMYKLSPNTETFLKTATWTFQSKTEIDLPAHVLWDILIDDRAWKIWHPEITDIVWMDDAAPHKQGSERTVAFIDKLTGPVKIHEVFDVWEEGYRFGFYFKELSLPKFLTYKSGREEFKVESIGENKCLYTRSVAVEPGFVTRYLVGFLIRPRLQKTLTQSSPEQLKVAIANGSLPVK